MYEIILRELKWALAAVLAAAVFVVVVVFGGWERWPRGTEWIEFLAGIWLLVSAFRLAWWLARGQARAFAWWAEVFLVIGVALLAYGGSVLFQPNADYEIERYLFTVGATVATIAALVRRQRRHAP